MVVSITEILLLYYDSYYRETLNFGKPHTKRVAVQARVLLIGLGFPEAKELGP